MGFYNFCLSVILVLVIVGYCVRRRAALHVPQAAVLMLLFALAYFTHLVGFGLAVTGALAAALLLRPWSLLRPALVGLAILPSALLTMDYLEGSGFFRTRTGHSMTQHVQTLLGSGRLESTLVKDLGELDQELFAYHAGPNTIGMFFLLVVLVVGCLGIVEYFLGESEKTAGPGRLLPWLVSVAVLGFYLLLPNHLPSSGVVLNQGGFLKARFALMVPLIWLACFQEPAHPLPRFLVRGWAVVLLGVNLFLVTQMFQAGNQLLEDYTAGVEAAGRGHRLVGMGGLDGNRLVNPLQHAVDYYCLGTDNVNLDNYEAMTPHFPIKYRRGAGRGANLNSADLLILWRTNSRPGNGAWQEVFARGSLQILLREQPR
jgi:hypothetical protein